MSRASGIVLLGVGLVVGAAGAILASHASIVDGLHDLMGDAAAVAPERRVLYYKDPDNGSEFSTEPRKTADGRDFVAVHADEEVSFETPRAAAPAGRRLLYYRNPMGLPDTSPVPKKDWMGMDYIAVYEGDEIEDGNTIRVSLDKVQRSGVRTEVVGARPITRQIRAVGTVKRDETRVSVVTTRSDGYIEELYVSRTGQAVRAGEPLFRIYSPMIQQAQTDLVVALRSSQRSPAAADADSPLEGAMQRLRNLGVPEARVREVRERGSNPRVLDWPSPASGDVIEKRVVNGQRVTAGEELYRIADHSQLWVIADVAEGDVGDLRRRARAVVTFRAYPLQPIERDITLIYPDLRPETRTAKVRIEVPNLDQRLKVDMYADVVFMAGDETQVTAVPVSAVVDSGTRQVVLIARGEGRFEPRPVKLGRRGDGYVEVLDGVKRGEAVVTAATFLIDAESNLRAALQGFSAPDAMR